MVVIGRRFPGVFANRPELWVSWALLTLLFFLTGTVGNRPFKVESDGIYYYHFVVSLVLDGDLDFTNDYQRVPLDTRTEQNLDLDPYRFLQLPHSLTGKPRNIYPIGPALLWLPFLVLLQLPIRLLGWAGWVLDSDPWSPAMQYLILYSAVVYLTLALAALGEVVRELVPEGAAAQSLIVTL